MSLITLKRLLNEIISEVGDFDKIQPLKYKKTLLSIDEPEYKFLDLDGDKVSVSFQKPFLPSEIDDAFNEERFNMDNVVNVSFEVSNSDTQAKPSNYKNLIQILKTVVDIIIEYKSKHKKIIAYVIIPANKKSEDYETKPDKQKGDLYLAIIIKNISKFGPGWNVKNIKMLGLDSIVVYKV